MVISIEVEIKIGVIQIGRKWRSNCEHFENALSIVSFFHIIINQRLEIRQI